MALMMRVGVGAILTVGVGAPLALVGATTLVAVATGVRVAPTAAPTVAAATGASVAATALSVGGGRVGSTGSVVEPQATVAIRPRAIIPLQRAWIHGIRLATGTRWSVGTVFFLLITLGLTCLKIDLLPDGPATPIGQMDQGTGVAVLGADGTGVGRTPFLDTK